jgi:hypothetical protein
MQNATCCTIVLLIVCGSTEGSLAEDKPFNMEEWQRRVEQINHPNPANPKLDAIWRAELAKSSACLKTFIEKNVTATSSENDLAERACQVCDKEVVAEGIASYNNDKVRMPLVADKEFSIKKSKDYCRFGAGIEARETIWNKTWAIKKSKEDALKAQYKLLAQSARDCSLVAAQVYALQTSESAEVVATASFEKCKTLWGKAADCALKVFPNLPESDRWEALRQGWHDIGVSAVVDQRARQKLAPSPQPSEIAPDARPSGTGI